MAHGVCPWWLGYLLASPVRRLFYRPEAIVGPYVRAGMTVLEPGPGMGFFTLELARLVGPGGRVVSVDIQPKMLAGLRRRAERAGLAERIETRLAEAGSMAVRDLAGSVDFVLAAAVVHELPDAGRFFQETAAALRPGGTLLLIEPSGHVDAGKLDSELKAAARAGLTVVARPTVRRSHAALLGK
jgi:ubiquinone/menaquinone biosynthesis C-methylase UbiE